MLTAWSDFIRQCSIPADSCKQRRRICLKIAGHRILWNDSWNFRSLKLLIPTSKLAWNFRSDIDNYQTRYIGLIIQQKSFNFAPLTRCIWLVFRQDIIIIIIIRKLSCCWGRCTIAYTVPNYVHSLPGTKVPWMELSHPGTFVPGSESGVELSLPWTFIPWNFCSRSQSNVVSLPNANYDYLIDKLMALRRCGLFVSLYPYSFSVVKDGKF